MKFIILMPGKIKQLITSNRRFFISLLCVVVGVFLFGKHSFAGIFDSIVDLIGGDISLGDFLSSVVAYLALLFVNLLGNLFVEMVSVLIDIAQFNHFIDLSIVQTGWGLARDIANMFFIVVLLIIAFSTVLKISSYHYQKTLFKLVIMAVLVNFSKLIAGFLIDFFQVIMLTFVNGFKDVLGGNFAEGFGLYKMLSLADTATNVNIDVNYSSIAIAAVVSLILILVADMVILIMAAVLLWRIAMLWVLIIISPLAYLSYAFMPKYWSEWWQMFFQHLVSGPVIAFFLWLALLTIQQENIADKFNVDANPENQEAIQQIFDTKIDNQLLLQYMVMLALLMGGLTISQKIAAQSGSAVGTFAQKVQKVGTRAAMLGTGAALAGWALKKAPAYFDELQASKTGISLNPKIWREKFAQSRLKKRNERLAIAKGRIHEITDAGILKTVAGYATARGFRGGKAMTNLENKVTERAQTVEQLKNKKGLGALYRSELESEKVNNESNLDRLQKESYSYLESGQKIRKVLEEAVKNSSPEELANNQKLLQNFDNEFNQKKSEYSNDITSLQNRNRDIENKLTTTTDDDLSEEKRIALGNKKEVLDNDIKNVGNNYLSRSEAQKNAIKFSDISKKMAGKQGKELTVLEQKYGITQDQAQKKAEDYKKYAEMVEHRPMSSSLESLYENIDVRPDLETAEVEKIKSKIQSQIDGIDAELKLKPLSEKEVSELERKLKDLQTDIVRGRDKVARLTPRTGQYQRAELRAVTAEELKYLDTEDADELVQYYEQGAASKNKGLQRAALMRLCATGNDNEVLRAKGYDSNYKGFRKFVEEELIGKSGWEEQEALSFATDMSYINEKIGHYDTARLTKIERGKMKWMTEDEHVDAASTEIGKLDPQGIARNLNRLAYGGEIYDKQTGEVYFDLSPLGERILKQFGPKLADQAGRMNPNIVLNLGDYNARTGNLTNKFRQGVLDSSLYNKIHDMYERMQHTPTKSDLDAMFKK